MTIHCHSFCSKNHCGGGRPEVRGGCRSRPGHPRSHRVTPSSGLGTPRAGPPAVRDLETRGGKSCSRRGEESDSVVYRLGPFVLSPSPGTFCPDSHPSSVALTILPHRWNRPLTRFHDVSVFGSSLSMNPSTLLSPVVEWSSVNLLSFGVAL